MDISEIIEKVNEKGCPVVFLGDGVPVFEAYIKEHVTVPYTFAPATCHIQRATSVAAYGSVLYQKGVMESAREHKPDYLRLSQAERELSEKGRDFTI